MPTKLDRVQVLFKKELFQKLKLIAKIERRSLSSMVGSIVEDSIESLKYQSLLAKSKANELNLKVNEGKSLIKDILRLNINNEIDFDIKSKLKNIDEILSFISESNQDENEKKMAKDFLLEDVLEPNTKLENPKLDSCLNINKERAMLKK